jgi:hypothetical protein
VGLVLKQRGNQWFLILALLLTSCVSPLVNFTPFSNPVDGKDSFNAAFSAWHSGQNIPWSIHYLGSAFSQQTLIVNSSGASSLGPLLPGAKQALSFTPSRQDLATLSDALTSSGFFGIYDGNYGTFTQRGGVGGPDIDIQIAGLEKHVSKAPNLSTTLSPEAAIIQGVADAIVAMAAKYLNAPAPSPVASP